MRLDKYLKVARLIKRRTMANEACDARRVSVNDRVQRASYDVKAGDVIEISFGDRKVKLRVLSTAEHVSKEEASDLYEILQN
jgi:ribosomal 50S subunit-recycling heat shock protein